MRWLNAGFNIFPLLHNLSWMFFLTDRNDPLQIVALVRHQALFETIIDSGIASLNGTRTIWWHSNHLVSVSLMFLAHVIYYKLLISKWNVSILYTCKVTKTQG